MGLSRNRQLFHVKKDNKRTGSAVALARLLV